MTGMMVGQSELTGLEFKPEADYRFCLLCGAIFQDDLCRKCDRTPEENIRVQVRKNRWAERHARTHPSRLHRELQVSGLQMLPEAAAKAISYGIVPIEDMVLNDEVEHALRVSSSTPTDDAEGG